MTTQTQVRSTEEALSVEDTLKLALEGAANYIDTLGGDSRKYRQVLAQPEQEPVAWLIEYEACAGGINRGSSLTKFDYVWHECSFVSEDKDAEIDATKWRNRKETPLYTHPPVPTAQPKEPEQEPVAWMSEHRFDELRKGFTVMTTLTKQRAFEDDVAIYTVPPQRAWVGLTDEEINDLVHNHDDFDGLWEFTDAVEAKLKEKNTRNGGCL